ncbi:MAG: hypothetical protein OHK0036_20140 [Bacteroidia bacterium]
MHNTKEIYVRDAQGNILAVYEVKKNSYIDTLKVKEFYMYGTQRLGYLKENTFMGKLCKNKFCATINNPLPFNPNTSTAKFFNPVPLPVIPAFGNVSAFTPLYIGNKRYELNDWLGNVRVVINDRKTPVNTGSVTVSYRPQVVSVSDYYSFGSQISERSYTHNTAYRFSFNGKEDIHEQHFMQDYGARWYNKALGRFISADPLIVGQKKYSWLSAYQFASNTPLQAIDMDGLEAFFVHGTWSNPGIWNEKNTTMIMNATNNSSKPIKFEWSGDNTHQARYEAALKLVNEIYKNRNPDEPLTLIGHSHGGNVAILAANILNKLGVKVNTIITINTPVRPDYQLQEGAAEKHFNIYTESDLVQNKGGNLFEIPDEFSSTEPIMLDKGYVRGMQPIVKGKKTLTGELGPAGRIFKNAINIKYEDSYFNLEFGHRGYYSSNVEKWIHNINNNKQHDNKK